MKAAARMRLLARLTPLVLLGGAGCGAGGERGTTLTVLATASAGAAVEELAQQLEGEREGVDVVVSVDGSSALVAAVLEGAPADVLVTADEVTMRRVVEAGLADGDPTVVATNELQIVVEAGNPLGIEDLTDLGDVELALCQPQVPCGAYAIAAFEHAGLAVPPASEERSVTGVVNRVQLGEADAGLVYVTDVLAASGVDGVPLGEAGVEARYPAVALADADEQELARAFVALLAGPAGQAVLRRHGFGAP